MARAPSAARRAQSYGSFRPNTTAFCADGEQKWRGGAASAGRAAGTHLLMVDRIAQPWGTCTPFARGGRWPVRVDTMLADGVAPEDVERWVPTASILHSNGDALDIAVKAGRMVGVRGRAGSRINHGRLGPKDLFGWQANHAGDRLTRPLVRRDGELAEASWDEAMDAIVARSRALLDDQGPSAIGFYTTGQLFLEEYYTLGVIGKAGIGTNHMDGNTRLCTATATWGEKEGTFTNSDRTVHHNDKAVEPPGEARADLDIVLHYAPDGLPRQGRRAADQVGRRGVGVQGVAGVQRGPPVVSPRGRVRAPARIARGREGVVFVPFPYGYWDRDDGGEHDRAANELTITEWDPASKQPRRWRAWRRPPAAPPKARTRRCGREDRQSATRPTTTSTT